MEFEISDDEPVITTSYIVDESLPVLYVSHDLDEETSSGGSWQFHSGNGDYSSEKLRLVKLGTIIKMDPSIKAVADLPVGYAARRTGPGHPWKYEKEE